MRKVGAALVILIVLAGFAVARAGVALRVSDPVEPAAAIVVIGGRVPYRAMRSAALYREHLAPEVWLTMGNRSAAEVEMEKLRVHQTLEHIYSQQVLERLGVPATAIQVIPGRNNNTATEITTIAAYARQRGAAKVILVTSSYHSRRVRSLWHRLVGHAPKAIVQYSDEEPFNATRWWTDAADAWTVSREWFGLMNAWLGFPIGSEHW